MSNSIFLMMKDAIDFVFWIIPVLLPIFLVWVLWNSWVNYVRSKFWAEQEYTLLEIIPPSEVRKTPAAMELFLTALHQTSGESTWIKKYIQGKTRAWFSLEIVSLGGNVHFYIWTRTGFRRFIESQLYSQYPGVEIMEAEDYSQRFEFDPEKNDVWGGEFALIKPDPYPIKTYVDYALDQEDKEEQQVDPIAPMIELLASLNPGEEMWFQFIVRAHKAEDKDPNKWFGKTDNWQNTAVEEVKKIREESLSKVDGDFVVATQNQTEGQKRKISAIERSVSKLGFDVGIRAIYHANHDNFDGINKPVLLSSLKQYNSNDLNGFKPEYVTDFDYPWQDFANIRVNKIKREMIQAYKDRDYFFSTRPGFFGRDRESFVLNTEELATVFHLPGQVSQAPTLGRVESRKAAPPPNLPI